MLNTTIVGLSTLLLVSSPFSMAPANSLHRFAVEKSIFSHSIHNLFYFNIFSGKAQFSKTTFDNILGGAIRVEAYDAKDQVINKRYAPNVMSSNYYSFESCMFRDCSVEGEKMNGGAVSIVVPTGKGFDVDISFEFSSFFNCYAAGGQGGAIYGGRIGDVDIKETCFASCTTREKSSTSDTGVGTACYIWHRASTERSRVRGSSFDSCPVTGIMNPNTETVFFVLLGKVDFDDFNFSNNFIEKVASGICLTEQFMANLDFGSFTNCTGECTIYLSGHNDQTCDINTINFVNCVHHADAKLPGILVGLQSKITIEKSAFVLGTNKYIASRGDSTDTTTSFTFTECQFSLSESDLLNKNCCSFNGCKFAVTPDLNKFTYFDSRECWEIEPDRLPASNKVYAYFVFFALFAGLIGFGLYLQITQILGGSTIISDKYDAAPTVSEPINKASYDAIPE